MCSTQGGYYLRCTNKEQAPTAGISSSARAQQLKPVGLGAVCWSLLPPWHVSTMIKVHTQTTSPRDKTSGHKRSLAVTRAEPTSSHPHTSDRIWKQSLLWLRLFCLLAALLTALVSLCFLHQLIVPKLHMPSKESKVSTRGLQPCWHSKKGTWIGGWSQTATAQTPPNQAVLSGLAQEGWKNGFSQVPS